MARQIKWNKKTIQKLNIEYTIPYDESSMYGQQIFPVKGEGMYLWDKDDPNPYLDLVLGYSSVNFGHNHPIVINSMLEGVNSLGQLHAFHTPWMIELSKLLSENISTQEKFKSFFDVGGSNIVAASIRLARSSSKKNKIITFNGGYHGTSFASAAATDYRFVSRKQYGINGLPKGFQSVKFPNSYIGVSEEESLHEIEKAFILGDVAAILLEPIQGAAGFQIPEKSFLKTLRTLCNENEVFLICDDIQMGIGRAGYLFTLQNWNICPDFLLLSKSLAGGYYPLSVMVVKDSIVSRDEVLESGFSLQSTFNNNPLGTFVALKILNWAIENSVFLNSRKIGNAFFYNLKKVLRHKNITNVRGIGMAFAFDFIQEKNRLPSPELALKFQQLAFRERVLLYTCGIYKNIIKIAPSIVMSQEDAQNIIYKIKKIIIEFTKYEK